MEPIWKRPLTCLRWLFSSKPEQDPEFRRVITNLSRTGMRVLGALALTVAGTYVASYLMEGRTLVLGAEGQNTFRVLDEFITGLLGSVVLALSWPSWGPRYGRLIVGVGVILFSLEMTLEDFVHGVSPSTLAWIGVALITGVGTMPYRAWQTLLLSVCVLLTFPVAAAIASLAFGVADPVLVSGIGVFMSAIIVLSTGFTELLYVSRYRAYMAKKQIADQADQLREMDRFKARFFSNISHEFRTPLTLILGPVEDLLQGHGGVLAEPAKRQLRLARRNGERLKRLINQLLDLSKLESGGMQLKLGHYDIVAFVRRVVGTLSSLAERRSIDLSFQSDAECLLATFDADKVEKITTNLVSNALKFTPENGKVLVRVSICHTEGMKETEISVRDTGEGIPENEQSEIFNRFHQVDAHRSHGPVGTGIGLALVKELVDLHEGSVHVESEVGFGSTFTVRLPIKEDAVTSEVYVELPGDVVPEITSTNAIWESDASDDDSALEEEVTRDNQPTVLVVDDNTDVREYIRNHLAGRYRVFEAGDGEAALKLAREISPDLIISDVMMPLMDGFTLCRTVKSDPQLGHIPFVLVTAKASDECKIEGLELGADDYLFKPFNASELLVRAENLIELRRLLRERFSGEFVVKPTDISLPSAEVEFLDRVRTVVEHHLSDSNFTVDWLADEVGISARQLQRRLQASINLSAAGFIRKMKLERSAQLLVQKVGTISEIAYRSGFTDSNYFSKLFRQTFGVPPSKYVD
jgi:signal transduction histidine kinase/AraC-like DNA-binding protein